MSASTANHSVAHQKIHTYTGYGIIIGLPFTIFSVAGAVSKGPDGIIAWLSTPHGALGFLAFFTAAIWYCKLEMDEVIMDYFGGKKRSFGLVQNTVTALVVWAGVAVTVIKLAFLG